MKRLGTILLICLLVCAYQPARAQSEPDPHTPLWYYNPNGGKYAHIDPNCASVSAEYLPLQLMPDAQLGQQKPLCPYCAEAATPIFTTTGGSVNLPNLQIEVYPTAVKVPAWGDDRVYRLHITNMDQPTQAFTALLFPSIEAAESIVPLVRIEDLNFDGYPDLEALRIQGASNVSSTYFLYSPTDEQYHYEPVLDTLSAYQLYPEQRLISNFVHDSAATGIRQLYRIGEDGQHMLYRQASVLNDEQSDWQKIRVKVTGYDATGAETVLMDEVREPFADDADYQASEQEWLALYYEGIPEAVVKSELGV